MLVAIRPPTAGKVIARGFSNPWSQEPNMNPTLKGWEERSSFFLLAEVR